MREEPAHEQAILADNRAISRHNRSLQSMCPSPAIQRPSGITQARGPYAHDRSGLLKMGRFQISIARYLNWLRASLIDDGRNSSTAAISLRS
jgi:hypothetical protein